MGHESFEKSAKDHSISDVGDLELVEAQDACRGGNGGCDGRNGIEIISMVELHLVETLMDVLHEVVVVDPRFGGDVGG